MTPKNLLRQLIVSFAVLVAVALPAAGQGKWWQSEEYIRELRLTPEQSKKLEEVFQASIPTLKSLKKTLESSGVRVRASTRTRRRRFRDGSSGARRGGPCGVEQVAHDDDAPNEAGADDGTVDQVQRYAPDG
jgi:hypothetical protein